MHTHIYIECRQLMLCSQFNLANVIPSALKSRALFLPFSLFDLICSISLHSFSYALLHSENVLGIGDAEWTNFGYPRWQLVLCLAFGWIVAFFCLSKGIKSAGKTVFFMAIFPYVILTALMVS